MSIATTIGVGAFIIACLALAVLIVRWLDRVLPMDKED